ncbi:MAG: tRNA(Ile)-lysidine synthetase, partial [Caulobacteraceae bacterium]|nr:tRNA(Ile)-lysidine synthetase [Caulobacteraceae bacterium]
MPALGRAALTPALFALDDRLDPRAATPLAIAVSGGGDSLALLQLAADWARPHGRNLLVLHVDHQLQPQSGQWADHTEAAARAAGARFERLAWTGDKPKTG